MTSPIDFLAGGVLNQYGLSLSFGGLLVVSQIGTPGAQALRVDARLLNDLELELGDLVAENSLETALLLSLFTDARATDEEIARHGGADPRGFWGDELATVSGDEYGSKLWLLEREIQTTEVLNRAREYAVAATRWIIDDGIARSIDIVAEYPRPTYLAIGATIARGASTERFAFVWGGI